MLKNLLLYRFALFNGGMSLLFSYLVAKGYVSLAIAADPTGITILIAMIFALLLGSTAKRTWTTSKAINNAKKGHAFGGVKALMLKSRKRLFKIKYIYFGANALYMIGLIGTVIGFLIAMGGVDPIVMATAKGVTALIPLLMSGMNVALYTTLAGAFFGIWTECNHLMLKTATACLVEDEKALWGDG